MRRRAGTHFRWAPDQQRTASALRSIRGTPNCGFTFQTACVLRHAFAISPQLCARFCRARHALRDKRAQGMPGARCARSLVCEMKKHTSIVTTVTPETPGIPRAMVLTAYSALSPVTGLSCHRRPQDHHLTSLTSASGCQDHTTSPSARPARSSAAPPASTASRTHVRDDSRSAPREGRDRTAIMLSLRGGQAIIRKIRNWARSGGSFAPQPDRYRCAWPVESS